ncbi:hypothetical protein [Aliikangiella sp. G2MR2-5]|uniref:hypothetical protein n=1 Tax=Aliikangiella sp. G2MR2-5 TaxID=2788943 RepID=UPI0018AA4B3C|nr:hypothetical protein [Aliikangiella sp. G2MR2-5]
MKTETENKVNKELDLNDVELITNVETKAGVWETPPGEVDKNEWWTITRNF